MGKLGKFVNFLRKLGKGGETGQFCKISTCRLSIQFMEKSILFSCSEAGQFLNCILRSSKQSLEEQAKMHSGYVRVTCALRTITGKISNKQLIFNVGLLCLEPDRTDK